MIPNALPLLPLATKYAITGAAFSTRSAFTVINSGSPGPTPRPNRRPLIYSVSVASAFTAAAAIALPPRRLRRAVVEHVEQMEERRGCVADHDNASAKLGTPQFKRRCRTRVVHCTGTLGHGWF